MGLSPRLGTPLSPRLSPHSSPRPIPRVQVCLVHTRSTTLDGKSEPPVMFELRWLHDRVRRRDPARCHAQDDVRLPRSRPAEYTSNWV